jgi:mono/diheme cytochrome c family protein
MPHVLEEITMNSKPLLLAMSLALAGAGASVAVAAGKSDADALARGRYLVTIAGCNDCHTPKYAETGGQVPQGEWLTGTSLGWQGPWGTTYPANLRLALQSMTEDQFIARVTNPLRPPMPWFALKAMTDGDRRAIYRYIKSLGPAGQPAPAYAPPGVAVATPVIEWPAPPKSVAQKQAAAH